MSSSPISVKKSNKGRKKDIGEPRAVVTQFYQTKLCKHFQAGSCLYGDKCSFSHSKDSIRERPNLTKTKLCPLVELGGVCASLENCPYAHNLQELRATPMLFRTVMCTWWKKGQCEFGDSCRFAHGDIELRDSSSAGNNSPVHSSSIETPQGAFSHYPAVFAAALAAATAASPAITPQQAMALSAAASAAALEAITRLANTTKEPIIKNMSLKKGFASSPALLSFFDEEPEPYIRDRAGSDPGGKLSTDEFFEELRKLWIEPATPEIPLMQSNPFLSASHMTLDSYQINID